MKRNEENKESNLKLDKLPFPVLLVGIKGNYEMYKQFDQQQVNLSSRNKMGVLGDLDISQLISRDFSV